MLHKLIKSVLFPLSIMPLIGSCSIFEPKTKVIEYDEEVKLSDGSMIWVHIKRHYERSGGREISNWFQGYEKGWGAKEVEISWDTGFPNVGRKSVFFNGENSFEFIDKVNNMWYIEGGKTRCNTNNIEGGVYDEKGVCWEGLGTRLNHSAYLYVVSDKGFLKNRSLNELSDFTVYNVLDVRQLNGISSPPIEFNGKKISWQQKLNYQNTRKDYGDIFGKSVKQF